ncbi:MAG: ATP-binding protein [Victivallales bacterium]|nr:ATP-binding protein [Victivallales bacterium]
MFRPKSFLLRYPLYVLALALVMLIVIWARSESLSRSYMRMVEQDIAVRAELLRDQLRGEITSGAEEKLRRDCRRIGQQIKTRITVIDADGRVMADSTTAPEEMDNHAGRPEVKTAMTGETGISRRHSITRERDMVYVALPVEDRVPPQHILRISASVRSVSGILALAKRDIILAGVVTALIAALLSLFLIHKVGMPIEDIRYSARRIAAGDLNTRIPIPARGEIRGLAEAINNMAEQLKTRLAEQLRSRKERDAILASLFEGVIAMNNDLEIIWMNDVAVRLLGVSPDAGGSHIYEVQRHTAVSEFAEHIAAVRKLEQLDLEIGVQGHEKTLKLTGNIIHGPDNEMIGVLIVISDFTEIRRLENFRRDFVANVSHEIRTPLTAIRGAVETLHDALKHDPAFAERLMDMIVRHCDRLNALNEDILCLAALEREGAGEEFVYEPVAAGDLLNTSINLCRVKAKQKNIRLELGEVFDGKIECDRQLIEQTLINLIDNAVKYSEEGSKIEIAAVQNDPDHVALSVCDYGIGIPEKHLPRLFERFYRVDKARSRKLGGTGLGLSIVKHVVQLHHGTVDVRSSVGHGSTFTVCLPLRQPPKEA